MRLSTKRRKPLARESARTIREKLTPTTEEIVRRMARLNRPEPVHAYELAPARADDPDDDDEGDDEPWR